MCIKGNELKGFSAIHDRITVSHEVNEKGTSKKKKKTENSGDLLKSRSVNIE